MGEEGIPAQQTEYNKRQARRQDWSSRVEGTLGDAEAEQYTLAVSCWCWTLGFSLSEFSRLTWRKKGILGSPPAGYQQAEEEGTCPFSFLLPRSSWTNVWMVLHTLLAEHKMDKRSCLFWKDKVIKTGTVRKSISRQETIASLHWRFLYGNVTCVLWGGRRFAPRLPTGWEGHLPPLWNCLHWETPNASLDIAHWYCPWVLGQHRVHSRLCSRAGRTTY